MATYGSIRYSGIEDAGVAGGGVESYADVNALPASPTVGDLALITGTNKLYVYDGTSWFNIAIVNQAPTAITGNEASYTLAIDGTPTVVTLVSTDPEGFPLTWSSSVSGDPQVGTLTQADNVFTITPSADQADEGTLSVTFSVTDGTNTENSTSTFTLAFVSALWDETVLSIGTSSTNSIDNSTFIDRSTNAHTVTPTGTPVQTAFHPYLDNWSVEFDGNGDYLSVPDNDGFEFGTGEFTVEAWVYRTGSVGASTYQPLIAVHDGGTTNWGLYVEQSTGKILLYHTDTNKITSSGISNNQWAHVAATRDSSNTTRIFIDGAKLYELSSDTANYTCPSAGLQIGFDNVSGGSNEEFVGYISNARVVKGTAVYTSAFTPPTENLTAITNTSLLTCQSNRFIDNSTNAHTITANGDAKVSAFNPFGQDSEYAVGENKGSLYSSSVGTGRVSTTVGSGLVDGDFTIEGWFYLDGTGSTSSYGTVINNGGQYSTALALSYGDQGLYHRIYIGTLQRSSYTQGWMISTNKYALVGRWNHIAIVRDVGKIYLYLNGVKQYFAEWTSQSYVHEYITNTATLDANFVVGGWHGYTSDVKFTDSAVYTTDFTPPTEPVGNTNSDLYLPMDNAGIYDKTGNTTFVPGGSVATSTSQTKFADTSIYFAGNGNYAYDPNVNSWSFGTGDFTWEMWTNFSDIATRTIASFLTSINSTHPHLYINSSANIVYYVGGTNYITSSSTVSINTWYHIALVRNSGTTTLYIDGTNVGSFNDSFNYVNGSLLLGSYYNPAGTIYTGSEMYGYIENLQILNGVAKYTANFTPPTSTQGRTYQEES